MSGDMFAESIYLGLWLVLVASALATRRLPKGRMLSLGAAWLAILLGLWALIIVVQKWL